MAFRLGRKSVLLLLLLLSCFQAQVLPYDFDAYQNKLDWEDDPDSECDDDIVSYNLFFSETGDEDSYVLLINTPNTSFTHLGLSSFKGCYRIQSVDRSGNPSELSEPLCNENCIFDENGDLRYRLPNAFSPNGDGINDTFRALGAIDPNFCPQFVLSVVFIVVDRSGREVFRYETGQVEEVSDIFINWDGKNNAGQALTVGTYFYSAVVRFDTLDPSLAVQNLNGWVQILR